MTLQPSPLIKLAAYALYTPTLHIKKIDKLLANLTLYKNVPLIHARFLEMMSYLLLISATGSIKKITEPEIIWPKRGHHILHFSMASPKANNWIFSL